MKFKIYKFDFACKKCKSKNVDVLRTERAKSLYVFKKSLIDTFSPEKFIELEKYTHWAESLGLKKEEYKSPRGYLMYDSMEIGMDMLHTKYGMTHEYHWDYLYFRVPIKHTELIKYFDDNSPNWVSLVKKI